MGSQLGLQRQEPFVAQKFFSSVTRRRVVDENVTLRQAFLYLVHVCRNVIYRISADPYNPVRRSFATREMSMVRKLFLNCLLAICFAAPLSSAFAGNVDCEDCQLFKHGVHRQVIQTPDVVCFWFVQSQPSNVLLKLYLKNGTVRPYTRKNAGTHDRICVGRSWVRQMTTQSFICNDNNHFDYGRAEWLEVLATKPRLSEQIQACLEGRKNCAAMGYPAYGDDGDGK